MKPNYRELLKAFILVFEDNKNQQDED
jgi:hypothetical protein